MFISSKMKIYYNLSFIIILFLNNLHDSNSITLHALTLTLTLFNTTEVLTLWFFLHSFPFSFSMQYLC